MKNGELTSPFKHLAWCLLAAPALALAAGGHHAVDDAAVLDTGTCKLEGWWADSAGDNRTLHAGAGCRVGPVELGLGADRAREDGASSTGYGLQIKWAHELRKGMSIGLSVAPSWQRRASPGYQGSTVTGLFTVEAAEGLRMHLNLGRHLVHGGSDETVGGVSADWSFRPDWQVMGERYRLDGNHFARVGLRWTPVKGWVVDASRAQRISNSGLSSWTLGFTREFD